MSSIHHQKQGLIKTCTIRHWVWYCLWFKIVGLKSDVICSYNISWIIGCGKSIEQKSKAACAVTWRIYKLPSLINRYDWHPFFCIPILFSCLNWCRWKEPQHRLQAGIYVEARQTRQQQGCRQFLLLWKKVLWKKSLFGELVFTDGLLFNACFCGQRRYEPFIHSCKQKGRKYCFLLLLLQVGLSSGLSSESPRFHNRNHKILA